MSDQRREELPVLQDFREKKARDLLPDWIVEHLETYASDPEKGHLWDGSQFGGHKDTPTLLLTTRGRRSGRTVTLPLIYGRDGDNQVIIASKGGAPENPAWYLNLTADPNVGVQVAADRFQAVARVATGAERERLWSMMVQVYPPYDDYQSRTERQIPVVVLTRA
jgi:deazaflavin-dependent oxidoreductase (nitroreductase family)